MEAVAPGSAPLHLEDAMPSADPAALERLHRWGGPRLVHELVRLFERMAPERVAAMRGDPAATELAAHALGSSCGQLGATRMQRICLRIERLAGGGELAGVPPLLGEVEAELPRFLAWLGEQAVAREQAA